MSSSAQPPDVAATGDGATVPPYPFEGFGSREINSDDLVTLYIQIYNQENTDTAHVPRNSLSDTAGILKTISEVAPDTEHLFDVKSEMVWFFSFYYTSEHEERKELKGSCEWKQLYEANPFESVVILLCVDEKMKIVNAMVDVAETL